FQAQPDDADRPGAERDLRLHQGADAVLHLRRLRHRDLLDPLLGVLGLRLVPRHRRRAARHHDDHRRALLPFGRAASLHRDARRIHHRHPQPGARRSDGDREGADQHPHAGPPDGPRDAPVRPQGMTPSPTRPAGLPGLVLAAAGCALLVAVPVLPDAVARVDRWALGVVGLALFVAGQSPRRGAGTFALLAALFLGGGAAQLYLTETPLFPTLRLRPQDARDWIAVAVILAEV